LATTQRDGQRYRRRKLDPQVRSQLSHLKVGDKVQTTYTPAMATSVTPARSM
jgi:hypothetical protein